MTQATLPTPRIDRASDERPNFSLVLGGPLFQLFRRARLADDADGLLRRRILIITAIGWLPLAILSLLENHAFRSTAGMVPFFGDFEVHARYLIALPLLIFAELLVHVRMNPMIRQFSERNLAASESRLQAAIHSASRLRNSVVAELCLLALVYTAGVVWRRHVVLSTSTWYALVTSEGLDFTGAGLWYAYVSIPLFQFILLRWYFRMFIWVRFLWQISRIHLNLIPTHPDRVGGLGFLTNIVYAFTPLLLAHGVLLSGMIANRIFYAGAALSTFKLEIFVLVVVLESAVLGPLLVFAPQLNRAKRTGLREYGTLAERYVRAFDQKWLRGNSDENLLGTADIQSLADLGNSFEFVRQMRLAPITRDMILQLAVCILLPLLPLVLTMFSIEQLLDQFVKIVF